MESVLRFEHWNMFGTDRTENMFGTDETENLEKLSAPFLWRKGNINFVLNMPYLPKFEDTYFSMKHELFSKTFPELFCTKNRFPRSTSTFTLLRNH